MSLFYAEDRPIVAYLELYSDTLKFIYFAADGSVSELENKMPHKLSRFDCRPRKLDRSQIQTFYCWATGSSQFLYFIRAKFVVGENKDIELYKVNLEVQLKMDRQIEDCISSPSFRYLICSATNPIENPGERYIMVFILEGAKKQTSLFAEYIYKEESKIGSLILTEEYSIEQTDKSLSFVAFSSGSFGTKLLTFKLSPIRFEILENKIFTPEDIIITALGSSKNATISIDLNGMIQKKGIDYMRYLIYAGVGCGIYCLLISICTIICWYRARNSRNNDEFDSYDFSIQDSIMNDKPAKKLSQLDDIDADDLTNQNNSDHLKKNN